MTLKNQNPGTKPRPYDNIQPQRTARLEHPRPNPPNYSNGKGPDTTKPTREQDVIPKWATPHSHVLIPLSSY